LTARRLWLPVPEDVIRRIVRTRFERGSPASEVEGYLIVWDSLDAGIVLSPRRAAALLGITRWAAGTLISRVTQDRIAWLEKTKQPLSSHRPAKNGQRLRVISRACEDSPATFQPPASQKRAESDFSPISREQNITLQRRREIESVWDAINDLRLAQLPGRPRRLTLSKTYRGPLAARLKEHGSEAVLSVWNWALLSPHDRARFLREKGFCTPRTLHRASNFSDYLELTRAPALRPGRAGRRGLSPVPPPSSPSSSVSEQSELSRFLSSTGQE